MIDLHVHTTHSDGRLTPAEAVRESVASGLQAIAITDHDVVTALPEATVAADGAIEVVPGIEMTARGEGRRAALVLGMLERGVLRRAAPGTGLRLLRLAAAEPRAYSVAEAVTLIHGAGGVASLAHPAKLRRGQPLLFADDLAPLVRSADFDALEAWQWIPRGWGSDHYCAVASELGLLVSGGSDDHGKRGQDGRLRLGQQPIPPEVLEALRERAQSLRRG